MELFENLKKGYSFVVGKVNIVSKKTGMPFEIFHVVNKEADGSLTVSSIFNNNVGMFDVNVGDRVCFLFSGNGSYKSLIEVKEQPNED